jgi:hypothetical protein
MPSKTAELVMSALKLAIRMLTQFKRNPLALSIYKRKPGFTFEIWCSRLLKIHTKLAPGSFIAAFFLAE